MNFGSQSSPWQASIFGTKKRTPSHRRKRPGKTSLRLESLERRALMTTDPATIPVTFSIPADLPGDGELYVAIFGTLSDDYTPSGSSTIPSGTEVYFDFSSPTGPAGDYASTAGLTSLVAQGLTGPTVTINLPNVEIAAGQIVMGVNESPIMPVSGGAVTSPASSNNPDNIFALFEFDISGSTLDLDASSVDQVGFPFTISTNPAGAIPAQNGVGITPNRADLFQMYHDYIAGKGTAAEGFLDSLTYGNGNRILAPQNVLDDIVGGLVQNSVTYGVNGSLTLGTNYYYWVTAKNGAGESTCNNFQVGTPYTDSGSGNNYQTVNLSWEQFTDATGYNIYRSTSSDVTT